MKNGRNGLDSLAFLSIVIAVVLFALASVIQDRAYALIPGIAAIALLSYALFRILSPNTAKRRYESDRFESIFKKDPYKKFKCPKCGTLCRVPRGKGKIKIHCPKCGEEFIKRS